MARRSDRTSDGSGVASGSANSSGILPTTAASRARGKAAKDAATGAAGERRFEDLMMDQTADVGELTFITEARRPAARPAAAPSSSSASSSFTVKRKRTAAPEAAAVEQHNGSSSARAAAPRKARKTLGEEIGDEGFIFTREGRRPPTPPATDEEAGAGAAPSRKTSGSSSTKRGAGIPGSMGPPPTAKSRSNARGPASGTIYSDLPEEGETPIIRRNQAFRAGLPPASDRAASGSSAAGPSSSGGGKRARRDSLNLKATRRVSILSSGAPAHPHLDVPDWELFRHCSGTLPADERMAHIASWLLKRGMMAALKGDDVTAAPIAGGAQDDKRKKKGKAASAPEPAAAALQPLSDDEKRHLVRAQQSLEAAMEKTLRDLSDGKVDVSWTKAGKSAGKGLQPHPRNVANASSAVRLEGVLATMRSECSAWEAERDEIEAYRQRTQALLDEVAESSSRGAARSKQDSSKMADITAPALGAALEAVEAQWGEEDLSPAAVSQLADARESLASIAQWIKGSGGGTAAERAVLAAAEAQASVIPAEAAAAPTKSKARGRKSVAITNEGLGDGATDGTALDPRWHEIEFKTDVLRSRAHPFTQLSSLSQRYISLVSGRGAETLRRMAGIRGENDVGVAGGGGGGADEEEGAASAAFGSSSSGHGGEGMGAGEGAAASNRQSRRHVEGLLKGVRRAEAPASSVASPAKGKGGRSVVRKRGAQEGEGGEGGHDDSGLGHDEASGLGSNSVADDSNLDLLRALASASSGGR